MIFGKDRTLAEAKCTLKNMVTISVFLAEARYTTRTTELRTEIFSDDFPGSHAITVSGFVDLAVMLEFQVDCRRIGRSSAAT
jgi:2-iminobutanoate/2-iminopropanoate deaminase